MNYLKKCWRRPELEVLEIKLTMRTCGSNGKGHKPGMGNSGNAPGHGYDAGPGMGPGEGNGYGHNLCDS